VRVADAGHGEPRRLYALVGRQSEWRQQSVRGQSSAIVMPQELAVIAGDTGEVLARQPLPYDPALNVPQVLDLSVETGCLSRAGLPHGVVLRESRGDTQGGGHSLWAYNGDLRLIWRRSVQPPYGHGNAVHLCDLNGDGLSEVLAGGNLLGSDGRLLWRHDRGAELSQMSGAHHYDAALAGRFADDPEVDPIAFLLAGSAGVYVVDARTGATRSVHRVGHAQWGTVCKVRDDLPGRQVLVGTRWGNYGILSLFSGRGERLWAIQPDYILQGSAAVQWPSGGPQHIWINTSLDAFGLYDGNGRLVQRLERLRALWDRRAKWQVFRPSPDAGDLLGALKDGRWLLFRPA